MPLERLPIRSDDEVDFASIKFFKFLFCGFFQNDSDMWSLLGHIPQYTRHKQLYCIVRRDQADPPLRRERVEGRLGHDQRFGLEKNLVQWLSKALREGRWLHPATDQNDEFVIEVFSQPCQCAAQ